MYQNKPAANQPNDEISINFAGPFQNAYKQKKYLSFDNNSGCANAFFFFQIHPRTN